MWGNPGDTQTTLHQPLLHVMPLHDTDVTGCIVSPPLKMHWGPNPWYFIWRWNLYIHNQFTMRPLFRVGPNPMWLVFPWRKEAWGKYHVKTETYRKVVMLEHDWSIASVSHGTRMGTRGKDAPLMAPGNTIFSARWFWISGLWNYEWVYFSC